MGQCSSSNDVRTKTDQQITFWQQRDLRKEKAVHKLLLLGPGDSGKSTLAKQLVRVYGGGFNTKQRVQYRRNIFENVLSGIKLLLDASEEHKERIVRGEVLDCSMRTSVRESIKFIDEQPLNATVTCKTVQHIKKLWADPGLQNTFACRDLFQYPYDFEYFYSRLDDIAHPNYIPTFEDLLHSRNRTTGILENNILINGNVFQIVDVGGQRSERRKWIHCFEDVTGVIFVAAISEYDQILLEDEDVNRMSETLELFDEICNSHWFNETPIITFLNKTDLFMEKYKRSPFSRCPAFESYDGPDPPGKDSLGKKAAIDYIGKLFLALDKSVDRSLTIELTCAMDTQNVEDTFNHIERSVLNGSPLVPSIDSDESS